jgi:type IV pilus assembly protein PilX
MSKTILSRKTSMHRSHNSQRGIVLLIALTVLVAMSLAGVALMRSVDNTVAIAGNISFKQASLQVAERGTRDAMAWLQGQHITNPTALYSDDPNSGFYSARPPTEPDWFDSGTWSNAVVTNGGLPDATGNTVKYVIHRMCSVPGVADNGDLQQCSRYYPPSQKLDSTSKAVGRAQYDSTAQLFFRVTTRVEGPRNNVTITQTAVLL